MDSEDGFSETNSRSIAGVMDFFNLCNRDGERHWVHFDMEKHNNIDIRVSVCALYIPAAETLQWSKAHVEPRVESRWWRRERWTSRPPLPRAGMCRTYRIVLEYTEKYWRSEYPAERESRERSLLLKG